MKHNNHNASLERDVIQNMLHKRFFSEGGRKINIMNTELQHPENYKKRTVLKKIKKIMT